LKESLKLDIGARNKKRPIDDLTAQCMPAAKTSIQSSLSAILHTKQPADVLELCPAGTPDQNGNEK